MANADHILENYTKAFPASQQLYERAQQRFPNGVTHDGRFFEPFPIYIEHASGSRKWDRDGHEFVDYWSGHGALMLGHGAPCIVQAVQEQVARGTHLGACHELEIRWADLVCELIPTAERVRFTGTGTEATLMAIRLCRTFARKSKVVKFASHFHGWHDAAIPGVLPPYEATVPGIPEGTLSTTVVCPPNDAQALEDVLSGDDDIACVIIEPTGGAWGTVPTPGEFLHQLREITERHGVLLIFDEVITGFRVAPGGAQAYYGIRPDLTTLAKILAGGLPSGCVTGRADILSQLEIRDDSEWMSQRKMPHPGTFNANPLSATAGIAMLEQVKTGVPIKTANAMAAKLREQMNAVIDRYGLNWCVYGDFSMFKLLLGHDRLGVAARDFDVLDYDYRKLKEISDPSLPQLMRAGMLLNGVDLFKAGGMTTGAHTEEDVALTVQAFEQTIQWLMQKPLG